MVEILYQQNDSMLQDDEKICIGIYIDRNKILIIELYKFNNSPI